MNPTSTKGVPKQEIPTPPASYHNMAPFNKPLLSRRYFLTWSSLLPAGADPTNLCDLFTSCIQEARLYYCCLEKHEDGTFHIHALLQYESRKAIWDSTYFDVDGHHPNIQVVKYTKKDLVKIIRYMRKGGIHWGPLTEMDHETPEDAYAQALISKTKEEARLVITDLDPTRWFCNYYNIEAALSHLFPKPPPADYSSSFTSFIVPALLANWNENERHRHRPLALVLWGPSRLGKTQWARSLGKHDYLKGEIDPDAFTDTCEYRVLDDLNNLAISWRSLIGADPFTIKGKYIKNRTISPKPTIIIANYMPKVDHNNFDWWISNTIRVHIKDKLYT